MASGQTATEPSTGGQSSSATDSSAGQRQIDQLSELEQLLKAQGIKTSIIHRVGLRLYGKETNLFPRTDRVELVAFSRGGWEVATVMVGERAGGFLVSLPTVEVGCQQVNGDQPYAVVDLILSALPKDAG